MALVANEWNTVTFNLISDASFAVMPTNGLPDAVAQAVRDSTSLMIYVLATGATTTFTYLNGPLVTMDTATIAKDTPEATLAQTMDNGDIWYNVRTGAGAWVWYASNAGATYALTNPVTFGAFVG